MKKRDPHTVLGVDPGASPATVKAAWRRLARANHPDLNAGDPVAARAATARMVEINAAYERLRDGTAAGRDQRAGARDGAAAGTPFDPAGARRGGPHRPVRLGP